ncbi:MAG TPA: GAF domain-containing protein [Anaerolineales bacterium]|nr:GAF domain-containing protein [Anaerolineales bacterium]
MIRKFFSPPAFDTDEDNFRAKFVNGFAWVGIVLLAIAIIPYILSPGENFTIIILSGLIGVLFAALYLLDRGRVTTAGWVIVILGWAGIGLQAYTADGVKDVIIMAFIAVGLLASIVISRTAGTAVILISILVIVGLSLLEASGIFQAREQDPIIYGRDLSFIFVTIATLIYFSTTSLRDAIQRANRSEAELRATNESLQELNQSLEERVASRTVELQSAKDRNERRVRQFEAIAEVTRAITLNQQLGNLLLLLTEVISEKFGFYHVGIFLLDDEREFAVLRAANSDGGRRMLARNHKLRIGQTGIVGFVAATGTPRIALDVGTDAAYFDNPDLPATRSEMALALSLSGTILGVIDVQSLEPNAFQTEDVDVLATLADQVTIAIQYAQSFESTQKFLEEAKRSSDSYLVDSWRALNARSQMLGYSTAGNVVRPLDKPLQASLITDASVNGEPAYENGTRASLTVPIRLAGSVVGALHVQLQEHEWDSDEIDIAQAVADRLSLALEATTLLEATQKRAEIERLTADITGKIGSSTRIDSILRTAAEELSRVLGGSDVLVQILPETLEA